MIDQIIRAGANFDLIPYTGGRTFKRAPFLPQQAGPGVGAPTAAPTVGDWTAAATAQLAARRAKRGR